MTLIPHMYENNFKNNFLRFPCTRRITMTSGDRSNIVFFYLYENICFVCINVYVYNIFTDTYAFRLTLAITFIFPV